MRCVSGASKRAREIAAKPTDDALIHATLHASLDFVGHRRRCAVLAAFGPRSGWRGGRARHRRIGRFAILHALLVA